MVVDTKFDSVHKQNLGKLSKERADELLRLNLELNVAKDDRQRLKKKYDSALARAKILEDEVCLTWSKEFC